jgi:hypothetical protein
MPNTRTNAGAHAFRCALIHDHLTATIIEYPHQAFITTRYRNHAAYGGQ